MASASDRSSAVARDLHAAPAAAGRRLDQHRKADLAAIAIASRRRVTPPSEPGTTGMPSRCGGALGLDLVAHDADVLGLRADEMRCRAREDLGEARVLGQEAVARMHRVGAGDLAGGEQRRDVEVAVARRRRADAHALVGKPHMHGVGVGGGMHRDRRDAEFLAGAQDAQRDLAAVGNEDLVEHDGNVAHERRSGHSMIISGSPNSTGWASSTRISLTVPERGVGIWFMVFIASMIITVWPCAHPVADLDEGARARFGRAVGGADHRRVHRAGLVGRALRADPPRRGLPRPAAAATGAAR